MSADHAWSMKHSEKDPIACYDGLAGLAVGGGRIESPGALLSALAIDPDTAGYFSDQALAVTPPVLVSVEGAFKRHIDQKRLVLCAGVPARAALDHARQPSQQHGRRHGLFLVHPSNLMFDVLVKRGNSRRCRVLAVPGRHPRQTSSSETGRRQTKTLCNVNKAQLVVFARPGDGVYVRSSLAMASGSSSMRKPSFPSRTRISGSIQSQ